MWLGSSHDDLLGFPDEAKKSPGYNLDKVQRGLEPSDWRPMTSIGKGVKELGIHVNNEYRLIYLARRNEVVYVLHSFIKKTQKTSNWDIELAKKRFAQVPS